MLVLQNKPSSKDTRGDKSHFKRTKREKQQNKIANTFCLQNCSIQIVNGVFFIEYCVFKYFLAILHRTFSTYILLLTFSLELRPRIRIRAKSTQWAFAHSANLSYV